jgi:glycogen debranching enzyme
MGLPRDADDLRRRANRLKERFNESFWDPRGWFAIGLDGRGRRIDSMTTNPGHALWTGIADPDLAGRYLDHLTESPMWTGWGLRTLADTMGVYDPLSYHNGSVWPHDTALCAAGAARYRRWDVVDRIVDGALDAASEFDGRPPELFAGISRDAAPMPVAYPSSCSPQAWSSGSILLLIRTMLDLGPSAAGTGLQIGRDELSGVPDLTLQRMAFAGGFVTVRVNDGVGTVVPTRH